VLTSTRNPKVASAARLRKRAFREEDRCFLVEGAQAVVEALDAGKLSVLFSAEELDPLLVRARQEGVQAHHVTEDVVRHLTSTVTPQPVVGIAPFVDADPAGVLDAAFGGGGGACVAILHEVRDPGNAGTVLRSADAVGAAGVVFSESSVDVYNPKTVRSSAGSVFHLPIVRGVPTRVAVDDARRRGATVLAMAAHGGADLFRTDLSGPVAFVFGNEAHGLPSDVLDGADVTVSVPHTGRAESLNLAAAATVCLFEWQRRRLPAAEALESIIGAAAHDIRSPLTAMKGFGYALERRWNAMTDEQRTLMLRGIVHDADRMDTILRQLVDAARVVGGTLEIFPEQVDVATMVERVATAQRRDPDHPPVRWLGDPVRVFTDPARLRTALMAFCESLVWWGREGPIDVRAGLVDGTLQLEASRPVADLPSDGVEPLFTPRRPGEGAGSKIGLFVARGVAEAQGGRCWGTLEEGVLSFRLEVPAAPRPTAPDVASR
jgi:RNA methyltransferase, TrmH family